MIEAEETGNKYITTEQWADYVISNHLFSPYDFSDGPKTQGLYFFGEPVIRVSHGYLVWRQCSWCGAKPFPVNGLCVACGGYVEGGEYA